MARDDRDFWGEVFSCPCGCRRGRCCRSHAIKILRAAAAVVGDELDRNEAWVCHAIPPREVPNLPTCMAKAYHIAYDILLNDADALGAVAEALLTIRR